MSDPIFQRAVEVAEGFADGLVSKNELEAAYQAAYALHHDRTAPHWNERRTQQAAYLAYVCCLNKVTDAANFTTATPANEDGTPAQARSEALICDLYRCVFGNPFRPSPAFPKKWRTETVSALASGIYEERAFDRLPILADALEDAGCDDPAMLAHLRADGPHCRGCWVLDLALGK